MDSNQHTVVLAEYYVLQTNRYSALHAQIPLPTPTQHNTDLL